MNCNYIIKSKNFEKIIEASIDSRDNSTITTLKDSLSELTEEDLQQIIKDIEKEPVQIGILQDLIEIPDLVGNTSLNDLFENQQNENEYQSLFNSLFKRISELTNIYRNNILIGSFQSNELFSYYNPNQDFFIININDTLSYSKLNILKSFYDFLIYKDTELRKELGIKTDQDTEIFIKDVFNNPVEHPEVLQKLKQYLQIDPKLIQNFKEINNSTEKQKLLYNIETITCKDQLYTKYKSQANPDNYYSDLQESDDFEKDSKSIKNFIENNLSMGDLIILDIGQVRETKNGFEPQSKFQSRKNHYPYGKSYIFYKTFSNKKDGNEIFGIQLIDPKNGTLVEKIYSDTELLWFSKNSVQNLYDNNNNRQYIIKTDAYKYNIKYKKWDPDFQSYDTNINLQATIDTFKSKIYKETHKNYINIKKNEKDEKINTRAVQFDGSVSNVLKEGDIFFQWDSNSVNKPTIYYIEKNYEDQFVVSYISNSDGKPELKQQTIKKSKLHPIEIRFKNENFKKLPDVRSLLNGEYGGYSSYEISNTNDPGLRTIEAGDVIQWQDSKKNNYYSLVLGTNKSKLDQILIKAVSTKSKHVFTLSENIDIKQDKEIELESFSYGESHKIIKVFSLNSPELMSIVHTVKEASDSKSELNTDLNLKSTFIDNHQRYNKIQIKEYSTFVSNLFKYIKKGDLIKDKSGKIWSILTVDRGFLNCIGNNEKGDIIKKYIQINEIDYLYLQNSLEFNKSVRVYDTIHLNQVLVSDIKPEENNGEEVIALVPKNTLTSEYLDHVIYTTQEKYKEQFDDKYSNYKQVEPENLYLLNNKFNKDSKLYRYRHTGILKLRTNGLKSISLDKYPEFVNQIKIGMYVRFDWGHRNENNFKFYRIVDITNDGYYVSFSSRTAEKNTISEIQYIPKNEFKSKIKQVQVNRDLHYNKYLTPSNLFEMAVLNKDKDQNNLLIFNTIKHIVENYFNIRVKELTSKEIEQRFKHKNAKDINGFLTIQNGNPIVIINSNQKNNKGQILLHEFMHIILGVQKIKNYNEYKQLINGFDGNTDLEKEENLIKTMTKPDYLKDLKISKNNYGEVYTAFINEFFKPINKSGIKININSLKYLEKIFNILDNTQINNQVISEIYDKYDCINSIKFEELQNKLTKLDKELKYNCK